MGSARNMNTNIATYNKLVMQYLTHETQDAPKYKFCKCSSILGEGLIVVFTVRKKIRPHLEPPKAEMGKQ